MKPDIFKPVILFTGFIAILAGCAKDPVEQFPTDPVPIDLTSSQIALIESENSFSFDIFKKIAEPTSVSENIIISPLSISYALSMALNGAAGPTRDAMLEALKISGITPEELNSSYKKLTEALLGVDKRVIMNIANSVWTEKSFQVRKEFTDILTSYYDAESQQFDILDPTAKDKMNDWIEDNTNGLIKDMIEELDPRTVMLLINAVYFKGKWTSQFDAAETVNGTFHKADGSSPEVPMMRQKESFKVYQGDGLILGEFPYGQGNFVMDIILPDSPDGIKDILPTLTQATFDTWISQLRTNEVELSLPKFKYGYKKKLKEILSDMGMRIAFTDEADFTNIAPAPPLVINDVTHQAFIETNEEGTEAAAATVIDIRVTSAPQTIIFNADHPFLYIIRETTTNSIIFMGMVANPLED